MNVQLFIPCFVDQLYPNTAFNMIKVLEKAGCTVSYNANQTCCGQPAFNSGFLSEAGEVASKFLDDFSGTDYIVGPSASCVGFIRNYYHTIFKDTGNTEKIDQLKPRIFEFTEFLTDVLKVESFDAEFNATATYHSSCASLRECNITEGPYTLLANVKGLTLLPLKDNRTCCGFGGTFSVKFNEISVAMADQKVANVADTGAEYIISTDLSCLMHLDGVIKNKGLKTKVLHIADVLANFPEVKE